MGGENTLMEEFFVGCGWGLMSQGDKGLGEKKGGGVNMAWGCGGQICAQSSSHPADAQTPWGRGQGGGPVVCLCLIAHMSMYL